jgi:pimeloyl-ACP methyl ester carboxylesterase
VRERPVLFGAYVATGVLDPDTARRRRVQRSCTAHLAEIAGDSALARALSTPGDSTRITEAMLFRLGGQHQRIRSTWGMVRKGLGAREYSLFDARNVARGSNFVRKHMQNNVDDSWLRADPTVTIPVLFALGRHDCNTPSDAARSFFGELQAPSKSIVWFESSAHFPFWEEPAKFEEVLRMAEERSRLAAQSVRVEPVRH